MTTKIKTKTKATTAAKSKPPGKRAQNKEKTKQAILQAALELFSQKGFYETTTKAISRKAKIAEGTLFNYFRTKEDLALYFFEQEVLGLIEWYRQEKRLLRSPLPEKLFAIIHHHLERLAPYEDFIGAVHLRALQPASKLSPLRLDTWDYKLRYLRFVREILEAASAAGEIPPVGDVGAYAFGIFHVAMITHWLHDRSPGKENTLALLDRGVKVATTLLQKGNWPW